MDNMLRLMPHPESSQVIFDEFHAEIERHEGGRLWLRYHVESDPDQLALGDPSEDVLRADELWKSTCFEVFVRQKGKASYLEMNFAPTLKWAAYGFDAYREGMKDTAISPPPEIHMDASASHFALEAEFTLPAAFQGQALDIALTAVIEDANGQISYWSLAHPDGKPDFHHEACFALKLGPPVAS